MSHSGGNTRSRGRNVMVSASVAAAMMGVCVGCSSSTKPPAASTGTTTGISATSPPAASTQPPFRIAVPADETGADSSFGQELLAGIKAAVAYVNAHGGISGRQVQLTVQDDQTTPATAVSEAVNMLTSGSYQAMFPATGAINGLEESLGKVATSHDILELNAGGDTTVADPTNYPTSFSISNDSTYPGHALGCMLKKDFNATTAGVIHVDEPFSNGEFSTMASTGIKIVDNETITSSEQDFTAAIQRIESHHPDVIIAEVYGPQLGDIFKNLHALGYSGHLAGAIEMSAQAPTQVVSDLSLIPSSTAVLAAAVNVRVGGQLSQLQQELVTAVGSALQGGTLGNAAIGWDGIQLIKYAYEHSPTTKTADLVKTLEGLNGTVAVGTLSVADPAFSATNHSLQTATYYQVPYNQPLVSGTYSSTDLIPQSC